MRWGRGLERDLYPTPQPFTFKEGLGGVSFCQASLTFKERLMIVRRLPDSELELYHHGIKGQRWGVRRYQNEDGSYTANGRKHYGLGEKIRKNINIKNVAGTAAAAAALSGVNTWTKIVNRGGGGLGLSPGTMAKLYKSSMAKGAAAGAAFEIGKSALKSVKKKKTPTEKKNDEIKTQRKQKIKDRRTLSDDELRSSINRIKLEQEYKKVAENDVKTGKAFCDDVIKKVGSTVATSVLTATTLYTIKAALTKNFNAEEAAKFITTKGKK